MVSKYVKAGIVVVVASLGALTTANADEILPFGALIKGTLANQKLLKDSAPAVTMLAKTIGCADPKSYDLFVTKTPEGVEGSRSWEELWISTGCSDVRFKVTFTEDGQGGAYYAIKKA